MPRIAQVVLPILRNHLSEVSVFYTNEDVESYSWLPYTGDRGFPLLQVRRLGGQSWDTRLLDLPVIELTAYTSENLEATENLLLDAQTAIWDAVVRQYVVSGIGYLHSYRPTMGPTQFDSQFDDKWRIQMLIQLGLRPVFPSKINNEI